MSTMKATRYKPALKRLQIELVKLQRHFIGCGDKILVLLEGRDAAGKDGTIKRIVEHLSPRETRVVALGKPSDRDRGAWYFQRYVPHLPVTGEFVLFNRSWYNRAGVEKVMGFCTRKEYEEFMETVASFELMLVRSGVKLLKYYLDIPREEQRRRLKERARDPLTQWKVSPIDAKALKHWKDYTRARDEMLRRTHSAFAPWHILRAGDKKAARINILRDILNRLHYDGKDERLIAPDARFVFEFEEACLLDGRLAR
jgi:polyphosphate kinase 2